jgi:hypothetical protein
MTLAEEAQRYLAVVDFFRAQGCEPRWRPETAPARGGTQELSLESIAWAQELPK